MRFWYVDFWETENGPRRRHFSMKADAVTFAEETGDRAGEVEGEVVLYKAVIEGGHAGILDALDAAADYGTVEDDTGDNADYPGQVTRIGALTVDARPPERDEDSSDDDADDDDLPDGDDVADEGWEDDDTDPWGDDDD